MTLREHLEAIREITEHLRMHGVQDGSRAFTDIAHSTTSALLILDCCDVCGPTGIVHRIVPDHQKIYEEAFDPASRIEDDPYELTDMEAT